MLTRSTRSPKHRLDSLQADSTHSRRSTRRLLRHGLVAAAAVAVTGAGLSTLVATDDGAASGRDAVEAASAGQAVNEVASDDDLAKRLAEREGGVSRSDRRSATDPAKAAALAPQDAQAVTRTVNVADQDPKSVARSLMGEFGFASSEFSCLESLWEKESGWSVTAANPSSSAYGIPQALPGSKMASAGADWENNPATQIRWGLGYIQDRYGSPCGAWSHSQANNWY